MTVVVSEGMGLAGFVSDNSCLLLVGEGTSRGDRSLDTVVRAVEGRTTLTISHQHAPSGRRRSRRTGETLQTRKTDQSPKPPKPPKLQLNPHELQYPKSAPTSRVFQ